MSLPRNQKPGSIWESSLPIGICLILAMLWPATYFFSEALSVRVGVQQYEITTGPGWAAFTRGANWPRMPARHLVENRFTWLNAGNRRTFLFTRIYSLPGDYRFFLPLWLVSIAMGVVVIGAMASRLRQQLRYKPGCCENCGYDLRASPERCPECGWVVSLRIQATGKSGRN
jgi:hypothetical protein